MLTLAILGFLAERSTHAYELRQQLSDLIGHNRPVSDGALYPAINRLRRDGYVERGEGTGEGPRTRQVLHLTSAGRAELERQLREPREVEISDGGAFFTLLAFLSLLPDPADQARVLRRRLDFLSRPAGFFRHSGVPVRLKDTDDPHRRGMLIVARAAQRAERTWLEARLHELEEDQVTTGGPRQH